MALIGLSVIVPVYNTQREYLVPCINRLRMIRVQELEILIIDDGSNDECACLLDRLEKADERIRVFHIPNGGVSRARNYGIDKARGEYCTFVDSDDLINFKWYEWAYHFAVSEDVDAVYGKVVPIINSLQAELEDKYSFEERFYLLNEEDIWKIQCGLFVQGLKDNNSVFEVNYYGNCGKIFKKNILLKERYNEKMYYGEDQVYNHQLLRHIKKALYSLENAYFFYTNRFGSATNKYDNYRLEAVATFLENEESLIPDNPIVKNAFYLHAMNRVDCLAVHKAELYGRDKFSVSEYKEMIDLAIRKSIFSKSISSGNINRLFFGKKMIRYFLIKHKLIYFLALYDKIYSFKKIKKISY